MTATLFFLDSFQVEQAITAINYDDLDFRYNFNFKAKGNELIIKVNEVSFHEMVNLIDDLAIDLYNEHEIKFSDFSIHQ
jgi:hypothetical protein